MHNNLVNKEHIVSIIKSVIGNGRILQGGTNKQYNKDDVMIYLSNGEYHMYKCLVSGTYSIPTTDTTNPKFKKLNLRGK